jgi:hypothetical protein
MFHLHEKMINERNLFNWNRCHRHVIDVIEQQSVTGNFAIMYLDTIEIAVVVYKMTCRGANFFYMQYLVRADKKKSRTFSMIVAEVNFHFASPRQIQYLDIRFVGVGIDRIEAFIVYPDQSYRFKADVKDILVHNYIVLIDPAAGDAGFSGRKYTCRRRLYAADG